MRAAGRGSGTHSSVRMESGHRHQVLHCLRLLAIALSLHIVNQSQSPLFVLQSSSAKFAPNSGMTRYNAATALIMCSSPRIIVSVPATPQHWFVVHYGHELVHMIEAVATQCLNRDQTWDLRLVLSLPQPRHLASVTNSNTTMFCCEIPRRDLPRIYTWMTLGR